MSFDGEPLYKAKYDDRPSVQEFGGDIINEHTSKDIVENSKENLLFLYIINPPYISIQYSIGVFDSISQKRSLLSNIQQTQNMFVELAVPRDANKASYFLQAKYVDSLNKFSKVYIKQFNFDNLSDQK